AQPLSLCSENCKPGTRKKVKEGEPFCCYICIPCPEGKISEEQVEALCLLILLPYMAYEAHSVKCNVWYPEHPLHSYHHSGDLIIGGITSHGIFLSYAKDFIKEPPPAMPEELTYSPIPVMKDKSSGLPFYQMVPKEDFQYEGILSLLLHFKWIWVGILAMETDDGERILQTVISMFLQKGVCIAFIEKIPGITFITNIFELLNKGRKTYDTLTDSKATGFVLYGYPSLLLSQMLTCTQKLEKLSCS
ncbi:hypothetical protein E2320_003038, partial [Naja naja]